MLLGLDLGTTNVKALVVGNDGRIHAIGTAPVALRHTLDGGVEQDIEEIWQATISAIRMAGRRSDLAAVQSIGVSSQGAAIQLRDRSDRCIGPVISWMDCRGVSYEPPLLERLGEAWFSEHIGHGRTGMAIGQWLRLRAGASTPISDRDVVGFVGDTIVQRFCGRAAHDGSSLSIACLYNPSKREADPDLLKELGLKPGQLPEILPARSSAGPLKADVAGATGLPAGIPVSPAVHDQYAASLGCGATQSGDVMFGAGTAWVLLAIADRFMKPVTPSAWVCDHILPGRWGQLLSLVVGGSAFKWATDMTNLSDAPPATLDEMIEAVAPGCEGLRLWPFFDAIGGYRRPDTGRVMNIRLAHGRGHLIRAAIEGLCFELARQLGWLTQAGCPPKRLIMCGGAAKSRTTTQIVADITGCTVICPSETEISSLGAAMLARAILERDADMDGLCRSMTGAGREVRPGPAATAYADMVRDYTHDIDAATSR